MRFEEVMENVAKAFEVTGVIVLCVGSVLALINAAAELRTGSRGRAFRAARRGIGQAVLLGLEILIVADIVTTITIDPTIESALTLGLIVLVRTFLSFSMEIELEGVVPWRRQRPPTDDQPFGP